MKISKIGSVLFNDNEMYFLSSYHNIIYFIIVNVIFYNITIVAHYDIGINYLYFFFYLALCLNISFGINIIRKINSYLILFIYSLLYLAFSLFFNMFAFDPILLIIINMFCIFSIKIFKYIKVFNNTDVELQIINYSIINDFDNEMAYQKYNMLFERTDDKFREVNEELNIMQKYNEGIKNKTKIDDENFYKYQNKVSFLTPKSLLLVIYKIILDYSKENVENSIITFKLSDESETLKSNKGRYTFEFRVNKNNLNKIKVNNKTILIKSSIEEISTICEKNKFNLRIKQGISKDQYVIRVYFEIPENEDNEKIVELISSTITTNNSNKEGITIESKLTKEDINTFAEIDFK